MKSRALFALPGALSVLLLSSLTGAQDIDVSGNLTMRDSTDSTVGNVLKEGVPFLHNFGTSNTFLGSGAGNFMMSGFGNTATGIGALGNNDTGNRNTATGRIALYNNTTGSQNTGCGESVLSSNTTGSNNTAIGTAALNQNTSGSENTAVGIGALTSNNGGSSNTAIGASANVSSFNLTNATAIGAGAIVNASNKIRLGDTAVTMIEGQVGFTASSDRNQKENFLPVDREEVLGRIGELTLTSWNFIGHDAQQFRHYGPMAQDFFAAFGHDGIGTIGTDTTITSTDMDGILMIAAQALEKRTEALRAENVDLRARVEALERRISSCAPTKVK